MAILPTGQSRLASKTALKPAIGKYRVPAVQRAFAILEALSVSEGGLTVRQIANLHHIPYSTAFYLLETMAESGYLKRNTEEKQYVLGHKLFALARRGGELPRPDVRQLAGPILQELVDLTGITGHTAVLDGAEVVYIDKKEPPGPFHLNTWVGKRNCAYSTSVGKALLMHLPESEVRRLFPTAKFVKKTDRTITSITALLADLSVARNRGYAVDDGEDGRESRCIAAPIFDGDGRVIASMGIVGIFNQIEPQRFDPLGRLIRKHAYDVSRKLGFKPPVLD